jgi:hypothetical protein
MPKTEGDFPESCLRGLREKDHITEEGQVLSAAFVPDPRTAANREDGGSEVSVNWEDDAEVADFTWQTRDLCGNIVFPHGVARVALKDIERINSLPGALQSLGWERAPIKDDQELADNPYH